MVKEVIRDIEELMNQEQFKEALVFAQKTAGVAEGEEVQWDDEELIERMGTDEGMVYNIISSVTPFPLGDSSDDVASFYEYLNAAIGLKTDELNGMTNDTRERCKRLFTEDFEKNAKYFTEWFIGQSSVSEWEKLIVAERRYYEKEKMAYVLYGIDDVYLYEKEDIEQMKVLFMNLITRSVDVIVDNKEKSLIRKYCTEFLVELLTVVPFVGGPLQKVEEEFAGRIEHGLTAEDVKLFNRFKRDPIRAAIKMGFSRGAFIKHFEQAVPLLQKGDNLPLLAELLKIETTLFAEWVSEGMRVYSKGDDEIVEALHIMSLLPRVLEMLKEQESSRKEAK